MGKEVKSFDFVECHIKDAMIGEEYANLFPLGFSSIKGANIFINHFKRLPPEMIYHPFSQKHVNEIKMQIIVYNKFDIKVPIFTISKDLEKPNCILPRHPKKWEDIQNFQFFIVGVQHMTITTKVNLLCVIL